MDIHRPVSYTHLECREGEAVDLSRTKQYLKSTAAKYAGAIACLKETGRPTAEVDVYKRQRLNNMNTAINGLK